MEAFLTPQFVSTVGVPAIICLYTLREVRSSLDKLTLAINKLGENHSKEIASLKDEVRELKSNVNYLQIRLGVSRDERN